MSVNIAVWSKWARVQLRLRVAKRLDIVTWSLVRGEPPRQTVGSPDLCPLEVACLLS